MSSGGYLTPQIVNDFIVAESCTCTPHEVCLGPGDTRRD